ncbi:hypothetical protein ACFLT1_06380, partial [Bacteroidota bacterium]
MKRDVLLLLLIAITFSSNAQIVNVPADHSSIQAAIDASANGDTILISEGTYLENLRFNGKAVTLASRYIVDQEESHISKTIINGSQPSDPDTASVVLFNQSVDSTSVILGLTITGGKGTFYPHPWGTYRAGGGVFIEEGSGGKIAHCIIRDNHLVNDYPQWGGGICAMLGEVGNSSLERGILIRNNIIRNNSLTTSSTSAPSGGGIKIGTGDEYKYGIIIVENNIIDSNLVKNTYQQGNAIGGGMNMGMCLPTPPGEYHIRNNIFAHNKVEAPDFVRGAGMMLIHLVVQPTYFEDLDPAPLVYNNLVYENESSQYAGGIAARITLMINNTDFYTVAQPVIMNNTIVDNKARYGVGYYSNNSVALLMNNIFNNDLSRTGATEIVQAGISVASILYNNLVSDGKIPEQCPKSGNKSGDPLLNTEYKLTENSPCIGKGIDSVYLRKTWHYASDYDFIGNHRPNLVDRFIDIGAIESEFAHPDVWPPVITSLSADSLYQPETIKIISSENGMIYLVPVYTEQILDTILINCLDKIAVEADSSEEFTLSDTVL